MDQITVSVICNAYNHEAYIAQCLDGIVMQKTTFRFEVLVHDDASTDQTADIIREYERKYPDLVKPIYQTENQYTKGGVARFQYPRVQGKYIAFCEGDDYWTDPDKLQKQYNAMEMHPETDICAHAARVIDARDGKYIRDISPRNEDAVICVEDVIMGEGAFVATNSLFVRTSLLEHKPPFRKILSIDYSTQILGALRGGMLYLNCNMAVYRYMVPGSWTSRQNKLEVAFESFVKKQKMLRQLNMDTHGEYEATIEKRLKMNEFIILFHKEAYSYLLREEYRECVLSLTRKERVMLYAKALFPWLFMMKRFVQKRAGRIRGSLK